MKNNSNLRYFINGGTGVLDSRQDYKELNMMMDVLIKNGDAKKVSMKLSIFVQSLNPQN